jgi:hypothetical protein
MSAHGRASAIYNYCCELQMGGTGSWPVKSVRITDLFTLPRSWADQRFTLTKKTDTLSREIYFSTCIKQDLLAPFPVCVLATD